MYFLTTLKMKKCQRVYHVKKYISIEFVLKLVNSRIHLDLIIDEKLIIYLQQCNNSFDLIQKKHLIPSMVFNWEAREQNGAWAECKLTPFVLW